VSTRWGKRTTALLAHAGLTPESIEALKEHRKTLRTRKPSARGAKFTNKLSQGLFSLGVDAPTTDQIASHLEELRDKLHDNDDDTEERRSEARTRMQTHRDAHREEYNEYQKAYMRDYRARKAAANPPKTNVN
jgi:predicted nucleotide-binding protein (sugar kinase/HSP70/actin superfamily)